MSAKLPLRTTTTFTTLWFLIQLACGFNGLAHAADEKTRVAEPLLQVLEYYMANDRDKGIGLTPHKLLANTQTLIDLLEDPTTPDLEVSHIINHELFYDHAIELLLHGYFNEVIALLDISRLNGSRRFPDNIRLQIRLDITRLKAMALVGNMLAVKHGAIALLALPTIIQMPVVHRDTLNLLGEAQLYSGYPTEAIETYHRTLALQNDSTADINKQILETYHGLAWSYSLVGLLAEGVEFAKEGVEYYKNYADELHDAAAYLTITLAWLSVETGDFTAATKYFNRTIGIIKENRVRLDRIHVSYLQNLILTVAGNDRKDESLRMLERSIQLIEDVMGKGFPYLAHLKETESRLLQESLIPETYASKLSEIDELRSSIFSNDHLEHHYSLVNKVLVHSDRLGDLDELENLAEVVLRNIDRSVPVPNSFKIGILGAYAALLESRRKPIRAEKLLLQMENIELQILGVDSPARGSTYSQIAGFYQRNGNVEKSNEYFERAKHSNYLFYGSENTSVSSLLLSQAENALEIGDYEKSLRYVTNAYSLLRDESASALFIRVQLLLSLDRLASGVAIDRIFYTDMLHDTLSRSYELLGKPNKYSIQLEKKVMSQLMRENRQAEAMLLGREQLQLLVESAGEAAEDTSFMILHLAIMYSEIGDLVSAMELNRYILESHSGTTVYEKNMRVLALRGMAILYASEHQYKFQLEAIQEVDRIEQTQYPDGHIKRQETYKEFGEIYSKLGHWEQAYSYLSKLDLKSELPYKYFESTEHGRVVRMNSVMMQKIRAAFKLYESGKTVVTKAALAEEAFLLAQRLMKSEAAVSVSKSTARRISPLPALDTLARQYEQAKDKERLANRRLIGILDPNEASKNQATFTSLQMEHKHSRIQLESLRKQLKQQFPEYLGLIDPSQTSISEIQHSLGDDEVLLVFLEMSYFKSTVPVPLGLTWAISSDSVRWVESNIGSIVSKSFVKGLRCGTDVSRWHSIETKIECDKELSYSDDHQKGADSSHLPFDLEQSQQLYEELFTSLESHIHGKKLLVVTHGALAQIPFSILVKERSPGRFETSYDDESAEYMRYQTTRWLIDDHAIAHYPTVTSWHSLRSRKQDQEARKETRYLAVANPLLDGNTDHPLFGTDQEEAAKKARQTQNCEATASIFDNRFTELLANFFRRGDETPQKTGGLMDRESLLMLSPLPETALEVCQAMESFGGTDNSVLLGATATEKSIKFLDRTGELKKYDIVHFATHSFLPGDNGAYEAGLVLTPPDSSTEDDDGYLSASEIANLHFDADWVILSACNTASGSDTRNEPLSGLASAFFYANAKSLLVSHWQVVSDAAVELVTRTVKAEAVEGKSRSEALRTAILELKGSGGYRSHPSYWAPFVMIGDSL